MNPQEPLMYTIMCGILLVLSVMMVITCLLVHHNKQLNHLKKEVKQSRVQQQQRQRQSTRHHKDPNVAYDPHHHQGQSVPYDDGYVAPNTIVQPMIIGKKPKPFYPPNKNFSPGCMNDNQTYANIDRGSESGNSYESVANFCA